VNRPFLTRTRTLALKGSKGQVVDVVASDEVMNFDQIEAIDTEALALSVQPAAKTGAATQ
jgi:hypothetical protein